MESKKSTLEIVHINFRRWNEALQTGDSGKVAELYEDETFLPTMSGKFVLANEDTQNYFTHFLEKKPFGKIIEEQIQAIDENAYVHSGLYNFEITAPTGERQTVQARFTFVWKRKDENSEWKIIHHHSSVNPEPVLEEIMVEVAKNKDSH